MPAPLKLGRPCAHIPKQCGCVPRTSRHRSCAPLVCALGFAVASRAMHSLIGGFLRRVVRRLALKRHAMLCALCFNLALQQRPRKRGHVIMVRVVIHQVCQPCAAPRNQPAPPPTASPPSQVCGASGRQKTSTWSCNFARLRCGGPLFSFAIGRPGRAIAPGTRPRRASSRRDAVPKFDRHLQLPTTCNRRQYPQTSTPSPARSERGMTTTDSHHDVRLPPRATTVCPAYCRSPGVWRRISVR